MTGHRAQLEVLRMSGPDGWRVAETFRVWCPCGFRQETAVPHHAQAIQQAHNAQNQENQK